MNIFAKRVLWRRDIITYLTLPYLGRKGRLRFVKEKKKEEKDTKEKEEKREKRKEKEERFAKAMHQ